MEGKICKVDVIVEGTKYQYRIVLTKPITGGMNPLSDDKQVMVYGTQLGTPETNRWHHFPTRNVVKYDIETE